MLHSFFLMRNIRMPLNNVMFPNTRNYVYRKADDSFIWKVDEQSSRFINEFIIG